MVLRQSGPPGSMSAEETQVGLPSCAGATMLGCSLLGGDEGGGSGLHFEL